MAGCGAAWLARGVWDAEVAGSNPAIPTSRAQTEGNSLAGSSPATPTDRSVVRPTKPQVRQPKGIPSPADVVREGRPHSEASL
jgi:hypothetical protein